MLNQQLLNQDMIDQGISRFRSKLNETNLGSQPAGQKLMRLHLGRLITNVEREVCYHKANPDCPPWFLPALWNFSMKEISLVALKTTLDLCTLHPSLVNLSRWIGTRVEEELQHQFFKEKNEKLAYYAAKDLKLLRSKMSMKQTRKYWTKYQWNEDFIQEGNWSEWTDVLKSGVGAFFLEQIRIATGFISFQKAQGKSRFVSKIVVPTESLLNAVSEYHNFRESLQPRYLPMVEPAIEWDLEGKGGYPNQVRQVPIVRSYDKEVKAKAKGKYLETPVKALNRLGSVGFQVNEEVLEVAIKLFQARIPLSSLPEAELPLPLFPYPPETPVETIKDDTDFKDWKTSASKIHGRNNRNKSKALHVAKVLAMAEKFKGATFYFPHSMDHRGRVYPVPTGLTPQGGDLAKGLLLFEEEVEITEEGLYWLNIYGANCAGLSKRTFEERTEWIKLNAGRIYDVGKNPMDHIDWLMEMSDPFCFLAYCFENIRIGTSGGKTRLPVFQDCSANAFQLFGLTLRDEDKADMLNLKKCGECGDFYTYFQEYLFEELGKSESEYAGKWLNAKEMLNRGLLKSMLVGLIYGGNQYTLEKQIIEEYHFHMEKSFLKHIDQKNRFSACVWLANFTYKTANAFLKKEQKLKRTFDKIAGIFLKAEKPIQWITPSGFKVYFQEKNWNHEVIETSLAGTTCHLYIPERTNFQGLNKKAMRKAFLVNFFHSLDASVVHIWGEKTKLNSIATVHDCFATHASNVETMRKEVKGIYYSVFSENILARLWKQLKMQIKDEEIQFPKLPPLGELNPKVILNSDYFIS